MNFSKPIQLFSILLFTILNYAQGQITWETLNPLPTEGRERTHHFVIENNIYIGGGRLANSQNTNEVWAYDTSTNTWTQKADFPGPARRNAVGFSDGQFGYIGLGYDGNGSIADFWKYDAANDTWTEVASFPGGGDRYFSIAISAEGKGYIAFGGNSGSDIYFDDIWEYESATDSWSLLTNLPAETRYRPSGYLVDNKLYIGMGNKDGVPSYKDFWEYDIANDSWTQKADYPSVKGSGCYFFKIGDALFAGEGYDGFSTTGGYGNKLHQYDIENDLWIEEPDFAWTPRIFMIGAEVNGKGYVGLGREYVNNTFFNDFYEIAFTPNNVSEFDETFNAQVNPNPFSDQFIIEYKFRENTRSREIVIYNHLGQLVYTKKLLEDEGVIEVSEDFDNGTYFFQLKSDSKISRAQKILKLF